MDELVPARRVHAPPGDTGPARTSLSRPGPAALDDLLAGRGAPRARPAPPIARPPVYRGLPRPVRLAAWTIFGAGVGVVIGTTLSPAAHALGAALALESARVAWYAARITGFLGYGALAGSVLYGLMLSTKLLDAIAHRPVSFALHKDLALVAVGLSAAHGLVLLGDHTYAFTLPAVVVPFASPYAPVAVGIGQVGFYLAALVTASFYVRRHIGQRAWRIIHYLTFVAFIAVSAHGIASGSDSATGWATWVYALPAGAVVFLLTYRIVIAIASRRAGPAGSPIERPRQIALP